MTPFLDQIIIIITTTIITITTMIIIIIIIIIIIYFFRVPHQTTMPITLYNINATKIK